MPNFKPMLAGKYVESKVRFPLIVQAKLDGIRASVVDGKLVTRTLKAVPNRHIRSMLEHPEFEGLDGELIVGDPRADDCYRKTASGVMSEDGQPSFTYFVFDKWDEQGSYPERWRAAEAVAGWGSTHIMLLPYAEVYDHEGLQNVEAQHVEQGFEGVILRNPASPYKFGRGSATAFDLIKLKRFTDFEAEVIGLEEEQHNGNVAVTNALGRTERSSAKAGKTGKGTMGKLLLRHLKTGAEFKCGTGFSAQERAWWWDNADHAFWGKDGERLIVKVKSFPVGEKDKPRHPVFLGFRDKRDM